MSDSASAPTKSPSLNRAKSKEFGVFAAQRRSVLILSARLVRGHDSPEHEIKALTTQVEQIQSEADANRAKTEDDIVQLNATIEHERAERALAEGALETARSDYARVQQQMAQERATRRVDHQRRVSRNIQDAT